MRYNAQQPLKITASKGKEPVPDSTSGLAGGAPKSGLLSNTRKRIIQRDKGPVLTRQKTYCKPVLEGRSWGKRTQVILLCPYLAPLRALQRISQSGWSLVQDFLRSQASRGLASPTSFSLFGFGGNLLVSCSFIRTSSRETLMQAIIFMPGQDRWF